MGGKTKNIIVESYKFDIFTITWYFVIFSAVGFLFEGLWSVINFGHWDNHYSLVWGPLTVIYGFAVAGLLALYKYIGKKNFLLQFIICFLLGSILEYGFSFFQELFFKSTSWDYSRMPYNLNGRICLRMSLIWGLVGMIFLRLVAPKLTKATKYLNYRIMNHLGFVLFVFMILNFAVSILATYRYSERHFNVVGDSSLDAFLDQHYPDERMKTIYYNMVFTDER